MSQLKCLAVVVAGAIAISAIGCARSAEEPAAQQNAAAPAAQSAASTAGAQRAGGTPAPNTPPAAAAEPAGGAAAPAAAQPTGAPPAEARAPVTPPEPPRPRVFTLEAGTVIKVQTASSLSTKTNKAGEPIAGTLAAPIVDGDWVIAIKGAAVSGVVVESDPGGRVKGVASMAIAMKTLALAGGETVAIATSPYRVVAKSGTKKDATKVAVGAGAGALVGAIAGGGKGAGIGAAAGAGAGTAAVLATRGEPAVIPASTVVSFKLTDPITVTKKQ